MTTTQIIAVSATEFEEAGCPHCGYRSGYSPIWTGGAVAWTCGECGETCCVLADGIARSPHRVRRDLPRTSAASPPRHPEPRQPRQAARWRRRVLRPARHRVRPDPRLLCVRRKRGGAPQHRRVRTDQDGWRAGDPDVPAGSAARLPPPRARPRAGEDRRVRGALAEPAPAHRARPRRRHHSPRRAGGARLEVARPTPRSVKSSGHRGRSSSRSHTSP